MFSNNTYAQVKELVALNLMKPTGFKQNFDARVVIIWKFARQIHEYGHHIRAD